MPYCFGDHTLDEKALRLTRAGQTIAVPRRVFDLLVHLLAHRQRAVSRDELIQQIWGRDNVSYHQLAQVVLAARQLLNDTGDAQAFIRTVTGFGYHWVGAVTEAPEPVASIARDAHVLLEAPAPNAPPATQAPQPEAPATEPPLSRAPDPAASVWAQPRANHSTSRRRPAQLALALCAVATLVYWSSWRDPATTNNALTHTRSLAPPSNSSAPIPATSEPLPAEPSPLDALRKHLHQGNLEALREGLARLPLEWTDQFEAHALRIDLDLRRGHWRGAEEKLNQALQRHPAATDPIAHSHLLRQQVTLYRRTNRAPEEIVALAEYALSLLATQPAESPDQQLQLADAHRTLGRAMLVTGQFNAAQHQLLRARDLFQSNGATLAVIEAETALSRVWMRQGRLTEALAQLKLNAEQQIALNAEVSAISTLNTATRIQIELLQWSDALASSDQAMELLRLAPDLKVKIRTRDLRVWILTGLGRLREAESLLQDGLVQEQEYLSITPLVLLLESNKTDQALALATELQAKPWPAEAGDVLYEDSEGALLCWTQVASQLQQQGQAVPIANGNQIAALQQPQTIAGKIAKGRWLWLQGQHALAEAELQEALQLARNKQHRMHMLLATEALVDLHLHRNDRNAASHAVAELRAAQPAVMGREYRVQLLRLRVEHSEHTSDVLNELISAAAAISGERRTHEHVHEWQIPNQSARTALTD